MIELVCVCVCVCVRTITVLSTHVRGRCCW